VRASNKGFELVSITMARLKDFLISGHLVVFLAPIDMYYNKIAYVFKFYSKKYKK